MTYETATFMIVGMAVISAAAAVLVRRYVAFETLRRHHEVGSAVFLQMGVVFAVLLAFVFTEVWGEYNAAEQAIADESSSLIGAARLSGGLSDRAAEGVRQSIVDYLKTVIEDEWPAMAKLHASSKAEKAFDDLWSRVSKLEVANDRDGAIRSQLLAQLASAGQQRGTRIFQAANGLPTIIWTLLILFAVILAGFLLFFGVEFVWSQALFTGAFAGSVAFVLVLIRLLDYPFVGDLGLSAELFRTALDQVGQGLAAR
jgi:hypothetical protein